MGDLTKDFSRSEFACQCGCGCDASEVDMRLVNALQQLRDSLMLPIEVLSGCRCFAHNRVVGGTKASQHLFGKAADIRVDGVRVRTVYAIAQTIRAFRGFGIDDQKQFLHLDVRAGTMAHWCYKNGQQVGWHE